MSFFHDHPLLIIAAIAVLAPLLREPPLRLPLPVVVMEILLGVVVGPHILGWVSPNELLQHLSQYGLGTLIFIAGMEIDFAKLSGRPLRLGGIGWLLSIVLSFGLTIVLHQIGFLRESLLVAVGLSTTAMGMLLPILKETGDSETEFGRSVVAAAAIGEFAPVVLFSLIVTSDESATTRSGMLLTFALIAIAAIGIAASFRPPKIVEVLNRRMHAASQLPIRSAILLLVLLWVLAKELGLDVLLGAFTSGIIVGLFTRGEENEGFREKMGAIGFGFLIPIFFVMSGVGLDLPALFASTSGLLRVPLFLVLFLIVRGLPALLYRSLAGRDRVALALLSATGLPMIVAIAELGRTTGRLAPENAAALVGAAILSVVIFPLLATSVRAGKEPARS